MSEDRVRVMRIILYEGKRSRVEETIARSIGRTRVLKDMSISVATINEFPDILEKLSIKTPQDDGAGD